ncbi:HAUS augmin-like complex subunit 6 [Chanos chanos]|uniref:HAUS augmin-like complex subunit 6 n=1 Tax=Chanos chanos TaxID=29144 RepID=A0A6J2VSZ3_CHACN|nr:HAUS augmin-like complex subunit 6 [Chanos chanos]
MSCLQKANSEYLWWHLLSLGFQPDVAASSGISKTNARHLVLGSNMFDKPNKEAFYIVTHFLLGKLNSSRAQDAFRYCWPVLDRKADAEFRKVVFGWLQEIAAESGSTFPRVLASHLLSPGGPKFISIMLHLAKHVMLQEIKSFSTDGTWIPEAAAVPARSAEMEAKRFQRVKRRFERAAVEEDHVIQEHQSRAKALEKSLRDLRAEDAKYADLLEKHDRDADQEGSILEEKTKKARSLWATVDTVLSTLEKERAVVESVVQGNVDQYTLDGSDLSVKIPHVLLERMEKLSHLSSVGNVYEAGRPVLLSLLGLLNEALGLLKEERDTAAGPTVQLQHQALQEKALLLNRSREALRLLRSKLTQEDIPQVKTSIRKLEADWERKWAKCLQFTPLTSFLSEDPALEFLSPMAPLSFEPASEASFKSSIFSQYPAKLSELLKQNPDSLETDVKADADNTSLMLPVLEQTDDFISACSPSSLTPCKPPLSEVPPDDLPFITPVALAPSSVQDSHKKNWQRHTKTSEVKKVSQILELECDNLASQFAEAVITSPAEGSKKGLELEQLLNTLSDPFSTRKQLPRTPESLIMEVRSSWRKAVEEGVAEKARLSGKFDSFTRHFTPVSETEEDPSKLEAALLSALETSAPAPPNHSPRVLQQGASCHSTLSWDSSQLEALNSENSSNIIQFSIAHETFPDLPGNDSLLSNADESAEVLDETEGEEELVLPQVLSHSPKREAALQSARQRLATILGESSFMGTCRERTTEPLPPKDSGRDDWSNSEKVFSLDLEQLESPSPPQQEEFMLPNLVTFSPIDDF